MSQIYKKSIPLDDLVRQSELIVVVTKLHPHHSLETISLDGNDSCTSYERKLSRFTIDELLSGEGASVGDTITVAPAYDKWFQEMHRMYCTEGILKSPICDRYEGAPSYEKQNSLILFLKTNSNSELEFACFDAFENVRNRRKIAAVARR